MSLFDVAALFVVADGEGCVGNQVTVDAIEATYYQENEETLPDALVRAVQQANARLYQRREAMALEWLDGTSTCTAAVLCGDTIYGAHVGASRAYLVRQGQIKQLTQDHTWVEAMVRAGKLQPQEQRTHPKRYLITHSILGSEDHDLAIDTFAESVQSGDCVVFCTDGLWHLVDDEELCSLFERYGPQQSTESLIQLANERGGTRQHHGRGGQALTLTNASVLRARGRSASPLPHSERVSYLRCFVS